MKSSFLLIVSLAVVGAICMRQSAEASDAWVTITVLPCSVGAEKPSRVYQDSNVNPVPIEPQQSTAYTVLRLPAGVSDGVSIIEVASQHCSVGVVVPLLRNHSRSIVTRLYRGAYDPGSSNPDVYVVPTNALAGQLPPIQGVQVKLCSTSRTEDCIYAVEDSGAYYFTDIPAKRDFSMYVYCLDWSEKIDTVNLTDDEFKHRDITLRDLIDSK